MKIWDIAAPQLIIEEAGGKVTDIEGEKIIYQPAHSSLTDNFTAIAANPVVHEQILQLVKV
jgi:3'-phosphoadenosine 5'-phosphosulfate (PAPS) 3'-phosphatase